VVVARILNYKVKTRTALMRCGLKTKVGNSAVICFYHEKLLLSKYHLLQKRTFNPFKSHNKIVKTSLKQIAIDTARLFNACADADCRLVRPGQKLCTSCRNKVMESINMWNFWFSWQWVWRWLSSGLSAKVHDATAQKTVIFSIRVKEIMKRISMKKNSLLEMFQMKILEECRVKI
jgi:hypothetical protein